jgi:hypothetical protein
LVGADRVRTNDLPHSSPAVGIFTLTIRRCYWPVLQRVQIIVIFTNIVRTLYFSYHAKSSDHRPKCLKRAAQCTYNVSKYNNNLHSLQNRPVTLIKGSFFYLFLKLVHINLIFCDNVRTCIFIVYWLTW